MPHIQLIWFADCPNHDAARALLRSVLAELAPDSAFEDIEATDQAIAERLRFPGSPTIRVDGRDIEPGFQDPGDYTPRCRLYRDGQRLTGLPERGWIEAALSAATA